SWNWSSTFAVVLAAPLGVGIGHGLEADIAELGARFVSREAATVTDSAAANAADKATSSLSGRAVRFTGGTLKVGLVMSVAMPASNALATGDLTHLGDYHTYLGAFVNGAALHGATETARGLGLAGTTTAVTTPDKLTAPTDTTTTPTTEASPEPVTATPALTDTTTDTLTAPTTEPAPAGAQPTPAGTTGTGEPARTSSST